MVGQRHVWRLVKVWEDHCPGGCYIFSDEDLDDGYVGDPRGKVHYPRAMFHGEVAYAGEL